jgi:hypothetical protein
VREKMREKSESTERGERERRVKEKSERGE